MPVDDFEKYKDKLTPLFTSILFNSLFRKIVEWRAIIKMYK